MSSVTLAIGLSALGLLLLHLGAHYFIKGILSFSKHLGLSSLFVGFLAAFLGTSSPELFVSLTASLQDLDALVVGNVLGSNIFNIVLILGFIMVLYPFKLVASAHLKVSQLWLHLSTGILLFWLIFFGYLSPQAQLGPLVGLILLATFVAYLIATFNYYKTDSPIVEKESVQADSTIKLNPRVVTLLYALFYTILGIVSLQLGSNLFITNVQQVLVQQFQWDSQWVGLFVVATATSFPELFTSLSAARQRQFPLVMGILLGSNITNILFVLGVSSLLMPIDFSLIFLPDLLFLIVFSVLLSFSIQRGVYSKMRGVVFLIAYVSYVLYRGIILL